MPFVSGIVTSANGIAQYYNAEGIVLLFPQPYYELLISLGIGLSALAIEWSKAIAGNNTTNGEQTDVT